MNFMKLLTQNARNLLKKTGIGINKTPKRFFKDVKFEEIPSVSTSSIRTQLRSCEIVYDEVYTNFVIGCPICEDKNGISIEEKARIFINKRTGSFTCESCKHTGSWFDMDMYITSKKEKKKLLRDPVVLKELDKLSNYLKSIKKNTILFQKISEDTFKDLLIKFHLPITLDISTFTNLGVRTDITHSNLYFPLHNSASELVGYKVVNYKLSSKLIEPKLANTENSGILIVKSAKTKDTTALVVANIADFLILINEKVPGNIVCLPNDLNTLSLHILPCLDKFNKLVLWFGNDMTSWDTARNYAKKMGEKRCLFIRPMDKHPLPYMEPKQDFQSIISSAQPIWHKAITTFASLRQDVLSDLQNMDKVQGVKWTRYPTLNRVLKGHRRGELTVITGPTGCGKTTFISDYSLDLAMQGVNTLWGSFEIRNARLARTMLQQMSGIPLDENLEKYDYWADLFEELPIYYMTFHGQQPIKVVMEAVEHAVYVHDINHVIIDNLQFMMGMSEDTRNMDRFYKQDLIIANFRAFATRNNCHVTLVIHPRKEKEDEDLTTSSIFGGAKASQEADNVLIIQDKRLSSIKGKKFLQVCKNRYSGDLGIVPLEFDKSSLSFAQKKRKKEEKKTEKLENLRSEQIDGDVL